MNNFNAEKARILTEQNQTKYFDIMLELIAEMAGQGAVSCTYSKPLNLAERRELTAKGFIIKDLPAIDQVKEGVFHQISW